MRLVRSACDLRTYTSRDRTNRDFSYLAAHDRAEHCSYTVDPGMGCHRIGRGSRSPVQATCQQRSSSRIATTGSLWPATRTKTGVFTGAVQIGLHPCSPELGSCELACSKTKHLLLWLLRPLVRQSAPCLVGLCQRIVERGHVGPGFAVHVRRGMLQQTAPGMSVYASVRVGFDQRTQLVYGHHPNGHPRPPAAPLKRMGLMKRTGEGSVDCPQRYNPKRICNDGHGRGFIQGSSRVSGC